MFGESLAFFRAKVLLRAFIRQSKNEKITLSETEDSNWAPKGGLFFQTESLSTPKVLFLWQRKGGDLFGGSSNSVIHFVQNTKYYEKILWCV